MTGHLGKGMLIYCGNAYWFTHGKEFNSLKILYTLIIWPSNPTLRYVFKRSKHVHVHKTSTPIFVAASFTVTTHLKEHKYPSIEEWLKKILYVSSMENIENKKHNIGESQSILLTKLRQTHKAIDCMIAFICPCENDKNIETKTDKWLQDPKVGNHWLHKGSWRKYCDCGNSLYLDLDCGYIHLSKIINESISILSQ